MNSVKIQVLGSGAEVDQLRALRRVASIAPAEWRVDAVTKELAYGPRAGESDTYLVVFPNASDEEKRAVTHAMQCGDGGAELNNFVSPAALLEFSRAEGRSVSLMGCRLLTDGHRLLIAGVCGLNNRRFPLAEWRGAYNKARGAAAVKSISGSPSSSSSAKGAAAAAVHHPVAHIALPSFTSLEAECDAPVMEVACGAGSAAAAAAAAAAGGARCRTRCDDLPDSLQQASLALVARVMRHVYPGLKVKLSANRKRLIAPRDVSGETLRAAVADTCSLIASSAAGALRKEKQC